MRKNSIVVGEKRIEGKYSRILAVGEVQIFDSEIKRLYLMGEANIEHLIIHKLHCMGAIEGEALAFNDFEIIGEANLHDICTGDFFGITGNLSADFLECKILRNGLPSKKIKMQKNFEWRGTFKAETFENFSTFFLPRDYEFRNIISSDLMICNSELVCDNFYSFGGFRGESINAENITMVLHDEIVLQNMMGSKIHICGSFQEDKLFKSIPKSAYYKKTVFRGRLIKIASIEGDRINIEATRSNLVSGIDVVIGDLSVIDRVEYKNSIQISEKAVVGEVIKV